MNRSEIAVATMTRVRDAGEERLVVSALTRLARFGMPVAVTDGGSSVAFVERLRAVPGLTVQSAGEGGGLVGQVQASLRSAAAAGRPYILYTEPDKDLFFHTELADFLERAPAAAPGERGVVVAARSEAAFNTFPPFQRFTEDTLNRLCAELTGVATDYCYGPFLFPRDLATYVDAVPASIGWGWRPFLFAVSQRLGHRIRPVIGKYDCPPEQAEAGRGERVHRMRQLSQNIEGLVLSTTVALPDRRE